MNESMKSGNQFVQIKLFVQFQTLKFFRPLSDLIQYSLIANEKRNVSSVISCQSQSKLQQNTKMRS